jgi:hypothetical protein
VADIVVRLFSFNIPGNSRDKSIDRDQFKKLLSSDSFRKDLDKGRILGLFTHKGRGEAEFSKEIIYEDTIAGHDDLANITRNIWMDDKAAYAAIDILNSPKGKRARDLIKGNADLSISMSCKAGFDKSKYFIQKVFGIDFTMSPEFDSKIVEINFSSKSISDEILNLNIPGKIVNIGFSLTNYLRENAKPPYLVVRNRILDIIRYMRGKDQSFIEKNRYMIKSYLEVYIYAWVLEVFNSSNKNFNIILALKLNQYVSDRGSVMRLQRTLNRIRTTSRSTGIIRPIDQKRLRDQFSRVMNDVYSFINSRTLDSGTSL